MDTAKDVLPIEELLAERRHLLEVARRTLGEGPDAESVVEETYRRWYALPAPARAGITAPRAWLAQVAGGICRDRPARYGVPERPQTRAAAPPPDRAGSGAGPAAPARRGPRGTRSSPVPAWQHDTVVAAVRQACATQDAALLASLLASDVTAVFDGGGKVRALTGPVHGGRQVARSLLALLARGPLTSLHTHPVNGRTAIVVRHERRVVAVIGLDVAGPHVVRIWVVLNPDKLRLWNPPPSAGAR
ncbi:RNA polymerase subunit sigma [Streptomyces sp. NPDC003374]